MPSILLVKYTGTYILLFLVCISLRNKRNYILMGYSLWIGQYFHLWFCCLFVLYAYMELACCYTSEVFEFYKTHHTLKTKKREYLAIQLIQV